MRSTTSRALAFVSVTALAWAAEAQAPVPPFEAGKHYTVLSPAQPTSSDTGKVEVTEIFQFGCGGCYSFEPHIQRWLARKADYVNFVRLPALWNPMGILHARAYYTAEALGKTDEIDGPFFAEFHTNRNYLDTEAKLADFFAKHGVDAATFKSTFNSFSVNAKLKRAEELVKRYRVQATPTIVVNGKFVTTGAQSGTYEGWFAIVDDLAAREHAASTAAAQ